MTMKTISTPVRSASFPQQELFLAIAEDEDVARWLYALLENEVERVFGEFLVSAAPLQ
jgi:hypothetical protein